MATKTRQYSGGNGRERVPKRAPYVETENPRLYENHDSAVLHRLEEGLMSRAHPTYGENAISILKRNYLKKDEHGKVIETPQALVARVAAVAAYPDFHYSGGNFAAAQRSAEEFYDLVATGSFMPNSPTLMNAGREMGMMSACFVLPVPDSIDGIFDSVKYTAMIQKAGGGTGFAFDRLRPTGDYISSSGGTTSGPISFWKVFSEATNAIQQGAFRRGANMGMMNIHHPDILKFIAAKANLKEFTNYNISVKMTDDWMNQFSANPNSPHVVTNPRTGKQYYIPRDLDLTKDGIEKMIPTTEQVSPDRVYTRQDVWKTIVAQAHKTGEPGIVFIDRMNKHNPTHPSYFKGQGQPPVGVHLIEATNPCGEQPLPPFGACNLGSVNLRLPITYGENGRPQIEYDRLGKIVHAGVRMLDNINCMNRYPLAQIEEVAFNNRNIGLGIMGLADAMAKMGVRYDSPEGLALGENLMAFINTESHNASHDLALERGSFANHAHSKWAEVGPMRNSAVTTVAPTGTVSMIANSTPSGEPIYALAYTHKGSDNVPRLIITESFKEVLAQRGYTPDQIKSAAQKLADGAHLRDLTEVPDDIKEIFVTAHEVSPEYHLRMQDALQKHCDSSISKTVNFANSATPEQIEQVYKLAWELGNPKGVTVYRDGCRDEQPLQSSAKDKNAKKEGDHQLVWVNVAAPGLLERKLDPVGIKVKVGHNRNAHYFTSSDVYQDKSTGDYVLWPKEIFESMLPLGDGTSTEFAQSGMERSIILKAPGTDLVQWIMSMKSVNSGEFGLGPKKTFGLSHATGVAVEWLLRQRGIIGDDEAGQMVQKYTLDQLNLIKDPKIVEEIRHKIQGQNGNGEHEAYDATKRDVAVKCPTCGEKLIHEAGCHGGRCPKGCYDSCS